MGRTAFNPVVVAPTYNNAATVGDILNRIAKLGLPIVVVNDGSTDTTAGVLQSFADTNPRHTVIVLTHPANQGKAAAMETGFRKARELGYTHAATIDTDGQLEPEQIPELLAKSRENPYALVLGVRDDHRSDYPSRSRVGRRVSNFFVHLESGLRVNDSQCGLRVYPLDFVLSVHATAPRFGYETEIITRAGWAGCPVAESPANCVYLPPGQRVSHFRPVVDSLRAVWMHTRLIGRALLPWPHPKWPPVATSDRPSWRNLVQWINPREAWRQLKYDQAGRAMFATGLGIGAFIANLPIYGLQTVFGLYTARRLHLHPVPVVLGTQVSTPPVGIALIFLAIYVGHILLHGHAPTLPEDGVTVSNMASLAPSLLLSWIIGSPIIGLVTGAITFAAASIFFRLTLRKNVVPPVEVETPDLIGSGVRVDPDQAV